MQRIARHAEPDRRLQALNQVELQGGRRRGTRAGPVHSDAARGGAARVDLADRVDTHREGDVGTLAAAGAGAVEGTSERLEAHLDVKPAAGVKERLAGDPARAPVLGDAVVARVAELAVELGLRQPTQRVLVEDRNLTPDLGVVQSLKIHLSGKPLLPERRLEGALDRGALALALEAPDRLAGSGNGKLGTRHIAILP